MDEGNFKVEGTRNVSFDVIRCVAIILVVLIHCTDTLCYYDIQRGTMGVSFPTWMVQTTISIFGRLGVPLFLMLTGALMLGREYETYGKFFKKKVLPLIYIAVIWFFLYFILQSFLQGKLTWTVFFQSLGKALVLDGSKGPHLWYMPMIIGIYLFLPLMSRLVKACETKELLVYFAIALGIITITPMLNLFIEINGGEQNFIKIGNIKDGILFTLYPLYVIGGYLCVKRGVLHKVSAGVLWGCLVVGVVVLGLIQYQYYVLLQEKAVKYIGSYLWYNNFFIFICGVALFELMSRINLKNKRLIAITRSLSIYSFGIYLIHIIFRILFAGWVRSLPYSLNVKVLVLFAICLSLSWAAVWIGSKIPGVNRYCFMLSPKKARRGGNL